jgi:hypothetical protein
VTLPGIDRPAFEPSELVIPAPAAGPGYWAGGPSAVRTTDGIYLAYRLRRPVNEGRGYANVVAHSTDGVHFSPLVTLYRDDFGCASLERPSLVRRADGGWRIYLSLSTEGSKHWWIDALDADEPAALATGLRTTVWPGDAETAVKDPVVLRDESGRWHAWVCCHPLTEPGAEDRMTSRYASSPDGLDWTWGPTVLSPGPDGWDKRGRRITAVLPADDRRPGTVTALYDGRASEDENWYERTGAASSERLDGLFLAEAGDPVESPFGHHTLRYATAIVQEDRSVRYYFEAANESGANEIRTCVISPSNAG